MRTVVAHYLCACNCRILQMKQQCNCLLVVEQKVSTLIGACWCQRSEALSTFLHGLSVHSLAYPMSTISRSCLSIGFLFGVKWTSEHVLASGLASVYEYPTETRLSCLHCVCVCMCVCACVCACVRACVLVCIDSRRCVCTQ